MKVQDIQHLADQPGTTITASVQPEHAGAFRLRYRIEGLPSTAISVRGDAFLSALLLPAMILGEPLEIDAPISPQLHDSVQTIGDIYRGWGFATHTTRVKAARSLDVSEGPGVGLFFSCGVDSFYSLLKNSAVHPGPSADRITHLIITSYGFDVSGPRRHTFEHAVTNARRVAADTEKTLVVVETNLPEFTDRIVPWTSYFSGALASVGHLLGGALRRCLIASDYAYEELHPWGSHPLLDPLWSSERLTFAHDGCEARRSRKVSSYVSASPLALATLRVCWSPTATEYNCGECEKCLRTMIALHGARVLDRCTTFSARLTASAVRRIRVTSESSAMYLEDCASALGDTREDMRLRKALLHAIRMGRGRAALGRLARRWLGPRATISNIRGYVNRCVSGSRSLVTARERAGGPERGGG